MKVVKNMILKKDILPTKNICEVLGSGNAYSIKELSELCNLNIAQVRFQIKTYNPKGV